MSETFRDAITATIYHRDWYGSVAGAVLAMPEMQAIRKALRCWWEHCACNDHPITDDPVDDFPDSVLAWVLDEGMDAARTGKALLALEAERALSDQLAEALRLVDEGERPIPWGDVIPALAAYDAARKEPQ